MSKRNSTYRFYESSIEKLGEIADSIGVSRNAALAMMIRHGQYDEEMRAPHPIGIKRMVSFTFPEQTRSMLRSKAEKASLSDTAMLELLINNLRIKMTLESA